MTLLLQVHHQIVQPLEQSLGRRTEFFRKHPLHQFFTQQGGSIYNAISNAEKSMTNAKERGDAFSELGRL
ncbi:MAG: hypothetical protein J6V04_04305 [Bacteroidales bacterium]|nr:hypothetical protein [Bacteroidales bacterium]